MIKDLFDSTSTDKQLKRTNRWLRMLSACNKTLIRASNPQDLFDSICRIVTEVGGYRLAWIGFTEHDEKRSIRPVAAAGLHRTYTEDLVVGWGDDACGCGPGGTAVKTRTPVVTRDHATDPRFAPWRERALKCGFKSSVVFPLVHDDTVFGLLSIHSGERDAFDTPEVDLLTEMAADVAFGITALRAREERDRAEKSLRASEEKYRSLFQNAGDAIFLMDGTRFLDSNIRGLEMYGCTMEDFKTTPPFMFSPPRQPDGRDSTELALEKMTLTYTEGPQIFPWQHRKKDGTIFEAEVSLNRIGNSGELGIAIVRDITRRKQLERKLRMAQYAIENSRTPILWFDSDGRCLFANEAAQEHFGYSIDEMLRLHVGDMDPDRPKEYWTKEGWKRVKDAGSHTFDARYRRKDGTIIPAEVTANYIRFGDREYVFVFVLDITERKRAEEQLKENSNLLQAIFNHSFQMMALVDAEGRLLSVNRAALGFMRREESELKGRYFWEGMTIRTEEARRRRKESVSRAKTGEELHYETVMHNHKDEARDVDVRLTPVKNDSGEVVSIVIEGHDITNMKRTERALRKSERRYRHLVDSAPLGIAFVDLNGRIIDANPVAAELLDLPSPDALKGMSVFDHAPLRCSGIAAQLTTVMEKGELRVDESDVPGTSDHGKRVRYYLQPLKDEAGKLFGVQTIFEDVTESRRIEAYLTESQKMDAIGTLARGIAHDFNNILAAIIGYTELAGRRASGDARLCEYNEAILNAARRARELVGRILTFSRKSEERVAPVPVAPVLREALKLIRVSIPSTIEIRQDFEVEEVVALADPTRLHQVVMNLCTNAYHAMEQTGILTVHLSEIGRNTEMGAHCPAGDSDTCVLISVSDTGCGIPRNIIDKIFDPYFTTKEKDLGTGLGLAVVRGIVEKLGGAIRVVSKVGEGTTFHVLLPSLGCRTDRHLKDEEPVPRGSERILLVDDEPVLADVGRQMLEDLGYEVVSATDTREALELFAREPDRFDLVLTDYTMPRMTGEKLAHEIWRLKPGVPIIIHTGQSDHFDEAEAREAGFSAFVRKPLSLNLLAKTVRQVLDAARGRK